MVSKEELKHIANLACLNINDNEIEQYQKNLDEILEFTQILDNINVDDINICISSNENKNRFRKDEVISFEETDLLLQNCEDIQDNMFKLPKVLN